MKASLSCREAKIVVEPYFDEIRALFVEAGLSRIKKVKLQCGPVHDTERHFAGCVDDGSRIIVAAEIADLPDENLVAILSHEMGHAADFVYPMRWQLTEDGLREWAHPDWAVGGAPDERMLYNRRKQWDAREHDEIERTADAVAEWAYGKMGAPKVIRYAGPCMLQSFSEGVAPRPVGLE